jgi:hypothetical protein
VIGWCFNITELVKVAHIALINYKKFNSRLRCKGHIIFNEGSLKNLNNVGLSDASFIH